MGFSYNQTKFVIDRILESSPAEVRKAVKTELEKMKLSMYAFYDGVIEHGPYMKFYTSDQWLDFHQKINHWRLRRDKDLMSLLSPKHRESLEAEEGEQP